MKSSKRKANMIALIIFLSLCLCFTGSGSYISYWQLSGMPVIARVTLCTQKRRSEFCTGFWFIGNRSFTGHIENASSDDIGNRIEARAIGDHAIKPSLRLPLVLLSVGILFALMSWQWWKKEIKTSV
jgi:hypothetical protein